MKALKMYASFLFFFLQQPQLPRKTILLMGVPILSKLKLKVL